MFKRLVNSNLIKRFSHTHSKTIFNNSNKNIEDLLHTQNKTLKYIAHYLQGIGIITTIMCINEIIITH